MKKLSIAAAGAAFIATGAIGTAPAAASTLTYNYDGQVNGTFGVNPIVNTFIPIVESFLELKPGTIPPIPQSPFNFSKAFSGSVSVDNPEQYLRSQLALDYYSLLELYNLDIPEEKVEKLETLLSLVNVDFNGTGSVTSGIGTTNFTFTYVKPSQSIVIDIFNPDVISGCLVGKCNTTGTGLLNISSSFGSLAISAPLTTGQATFTINTEPVSRSVPEPATVLGLIGLSGCLAAKRKLTKAA